MTSLWSVLLAYLLGAVPTGYLLVRLTRQTDVRETGSGNIGATNVSRAAGLRLGIVVLLIDALKAWLAVWLAGRITGDSSFWMPAAGLAAVLGNVFPVFLRFHGGKGFATAAGVMAGLAPVPMAASIPVFLITAFVSRHISAGSIVTAASAPAAVWLIEHPGPVKITAVALMALLILFRHRENIARLRAGTEARFNWRC